MSGTYSLSVHLFWIVPLVLLIAYLFSPRFRGDIAQTRVRRILAGGLEKSRYTVLNDLVIPAGGGTVRIDHVVVSKSGIFVIESQYASGWVSGAEVQDRWKQTYLGRSRQFDNPMHRNQLQREALQELLGIPSSKTIPVVVMVGQKGFKTRMPHNLIQPEKLMAFIRSKSVQLLDADQAARALKAIEEGCVQGGAMGPAGRWNLLRWFLILALLAGVWLAFGDELSELRRQFTEHREQQASPELFHSDGSRKTEEELWEDSLICASSVDTGRCSCYDPGGKKVDMDRGKCRSLAEKGSILK